MRLFFFIAFFSLIINTYSQVSLEWSDLSEGIVLEPVKSNNLIPEFREAVFSLEMAALEGKEVVLTGYFLILDGSQSTYLLSMNPMASCFFCGNGGPETIVELQFSEKPTYKMDDLLFVVGELELNEDDPNHCYYTLKNADTFKVK